MGGGRKFCEAKVSVCFYLDAEFPILTQDRDLLQVFSKLQRQAETMLSALQCPDSNQSKENMTLHPLNALCILF